MLLHVCTCYISTENYFKPLGEVYLTATIYLFHFLLFYPDTYLQINVNMFVLYLRIENSYDFLDFNLMDISKYLITLVYMFANLRTSL